ncbi:MAG: ATP-dependent DNA helicase DinG [Oceanicoccus sp.]|uniref:ATP-dependent DNA helicase DinG n=1 Tax=Oceanicoccus sp. TaxID=2691044 RepID=UPI002615B93D|nr:ATP-dependent DNA helicase DinG [Oceanicoccus sp.]MCP3907156.1 ATP-dependent DNA helicase DinG [Oceanicoccus sp.]MDG1773633.1 ATP-dependent DNA helicase DinG [Oceanicoccus sp.]
MLTDTIKESIQSAYTSLLDSKELKARYGQRLMIAEVARTLTAKNDQQDTPVCVVEAGTGTGKTIAYTVAAVPIAQALEKTLVISTATVALQEQIIHKDLPDILRHSDLSFNFALAKGRGRYLCLSKLDAVLQDSNANSEAMALYPDEQQAQVDTQTLNVYQDMLTALGAGDWDGDRDAWSQELDVPTWSRVTTDHAQCTGRRCANISQCCFYKGREQLGSVDVIVTNHDLVLADLALGGGAILPDPEDCIFIFDEGHHLPDKAINHFSQFSRVRSTERWLDQGIKVLAKAAPQLGNAAGIGRHLQALPPIMETLKQHMGMLFNSLESMVSVEPGRRGSIPTHRFEQGLVPDVLRAQATELVMQFRGMQDALDGCCKLLEEAMEDAEHAIPKTIAEAWFPPLSMLRGRAEGNYSLWSDYSHANTVEDPPRGRWIAVVEGAGGNLDFEVSTSPILAANTLSQYLWNRCYGAVITSATLTALGGFDRFKMRAGTPEQTNYAVVPSPFNFAEAGELVVPQMPCEPSDAEAHTEALIDMLPELLNSKQGSLVLFASRRQMEQVFEGITLEWQQRIIMQGHYPKHEVLRMHKEAVDAGDGSVIFGLASFAEGVDLPGLYCTHVVIAKIPFAVPDQPVESALAEWIESRGGNPFMDITVPDAALKLVQASGRLLRTETDSGRVTLLDRRVVSKRYGQAMLNSLPPFKRTVA